MKQIENWKSKDLICENCGTHKLVKWTNGNKTLCQKCIVSDILQNNQISMFEEK